MGGEVRRRARTSQREDAAERMLWGFTLHLSSNAWVKPRIRGDVLGAEKGLFLALHHLCWSFPNGNWNSSTSLFHSPIFLDCLIPFWILCRFDDGGGTHWWVGSFIIVSNLLLSPIFPCSFSQKTKEEVFWRWIRVVRRVDTRYTYPAYPLYCHMLWLKRKRKRKRERRMSRNGGCHFRLGCWWLNFFLLLFLEVGYFWGYIQVEKI